MLPPVIMAAVAAAAAVAGQQQQSEAAAAGSSVDSCGSNDAVAAAAAQAALTHLRCTHDSKKLAAVADRYAQLLARVALVSEWCVAGSSGPTLPRSLPVVTPPLTLLALSHPLPPFHIHTHTPMPPLHPPPHPLHTHTPTLPPACAQGEPLRELSASEAQALTPSITKPSTLLTLPPPLHMCRVRRRLSLPSHTPSLYPEPCCTLSTSSLPSPPPHTHVQGEPLRELSAGEARRARFSPAELADKGWNDVNIIHGVFGSACYIEDSWCVAWGGRFCLCV